MQGSDFVRRGVIASTRVQVHPPGFNHGNARPCPSSIDWPELRVVGIGASTKARQRERQRAGG